MLEARKEPADSRRPAQLRNEDLYEVVCADCKTVVLDMCRAPEGVDELVKRLEQSPNRRRCC